jgi:rhodanese-related sulfurtransferase
MRPTLRSVLLVAALIALPLSGCSKGPAEISRYTPAEAAKRIQACTAVLVDVREPFECANSGVVGAAHVLPLSDLNGERTLWKPFLEANRDKELILYCRSGNRSGKTATLLAAEGYRTANGGGLSEWADAGYAIRPPNEPRQPDLK